MINSSEYNRTIWIAVCASDATEYGMKCSQAIKDGWTIETCILYAKMAWREAKMALEFVEAENN